MLVDLERRLVIRLVLEQALLGLLLTPHDGSIGTACCWESRSSAQRRDSQIHTLSPKGGRASINLALRLELIFFFFGKSVEDVLEVVINFLS